MWVCIKRCAHALELRRAQKCSEEREPACEHAGACAASSLAHHDSRLRQRLLARAYASRAFKFAEAILHEFPQIIVVAANNNSHYDYPPVREYHHTTVNNYYDDDFNDYGTDDFDMDDDYSVTTTRTVVRDY